MEDGSTRGRKKPFPTWREKSFATDEVAKLGMEAAEYKGAGEVGHGVSGESHGEGGYGGPAVM